MIIKRDDDLMNDLYWFWSKICFYKKVNGQSPERIESQFNIMLAILEVKYSDMSGKCGTYIKTTGQTKASHPVPLSKNLNCPPSALAKKSS